MSELKFELRRRDKKRHEFWCVYYDEYSGKIKSIEPGGASKAGALVVDYARVRKILAGEINQNDYRVALNENLGALTEKNRSTMDGCRQLKLIAMPLLHYVQLFI